MNNPKATTTMDDSPPMLLQLVPVTPIDQFPPLPEPRYRSRRQEACFGISAVSLIIGVLVGITHGIALTIGFDSNTIPWWIVFCLIYGQAVLALLCLSSILVLDPGAVPRNQTTCYPLPPPIAKWLSEEGTGTGEGRPAELYFPSLEPNCQDTYCTRCLVWRKQPPAAGCSEESQSRSTDCKEQVQPQPAVKGETVIEETTTTTTTVERTIVAPPVQEESIEEEAAISPTMTETHTTSTTTKETTTTSSNNTIRYFHCNTCQRCIRDFDHHCTFFGRCIAGNRRTGNIVFFWAILALGGTSYVTCLVSVLAGLLYSYPVQWVLPFFFLGVGILHCSSPFMQRGLFRLRRVVCGC